MIVSTDASDCVSQIFLSNMRVAQKIDEGPSRVVHSCPTDPLKTILNVDKFTHATLTQGFVVGSDATTQ